MNKPRKSLVAVAVLILIAVFLSSCSSVDNGPHYPSRKTAETADNSAGMRFVISLDGLDVLMQSVISRIGRQGAEISADGEWNVLMEGLVDDNGVGYTSYVKQMNGAVLTAAVEKESGKLINVGSGCSPEALKEERKESFVLITAALAECVGGYEERDLEFLKRMIKDFLERKDALLYYEGLLLTLSEDEASTVVILSPSALETAKEKDAKIYE